MLFARIADGQRALGEVHALVVAQVGLVHLLDHLAHPAKVAGDG